MNDKVAEALNGRLDILVNNAAHMEPFRSLLDINLDVYWRSYEVNVHELLSMVRRSLPMLLSSRDDHADICTMLNAASSGALTAFPSRGSYRSSRLVILRWT